MASAKSWTAQLNADVRKHLGAGWSVENSKGAARLRYRAMRDGVKSSWASVVTGVEFELGNCSLLTELAKEMAGLLDVGESIDDAFQGAARIHLPYVAAEAPAGKVASNEWKKIAIRYLRDRELNGTKIGAKTLKDEKRYIDAAVEILESKNPPSGIYELMAKAAERWADSPRARQIAVDAINRFSRFCYDIKVWDSSWLIPDHTRRRIRGNGKAETEKEIAILSDLQILQLIDECIKQEWRNAFIVMATFGLRPEELRHLSVRTNNDGQRQVWCSYEKAAGGRSSKVTTKQRWLYPIWLRNADGEPQFTNLIQAMDAGLLPLPNLAAGGGTAVGQYLNRDSALWSQWKTQAAESGQWLRPYSLRNGYNLKLNATQLPESAKEDAMGHGAQTQATFYKRSTEETTASAFSELYKQLYGTGDAAA